MINSKIALDFINSKKIPIINYNNNIKTWETWDKNGEIISSAPVLLNCLDKSINIFDDVSFYNEGACGVHYYYKYHLSDVDKFNFLGKALFNHIWVDKITNCLIIGDRETKIPIVYGTDIRRMIDCLI